jgi:predicted dehydrogenase
MYRMKIYGAGSIGNHLANAARTLDWHVDMCDIDMSALERTREEIYPTRYGKWDDKIGLYSCDEVPKGNYDVIFIGTPPDSHMSLALSAVSESPKIVLVEKPMCTPSLENAQELIEAGLENDVKILVGYDHVVATATDKIAEILEKNDFGKIETLDVEFREHWGGIFAAHPWLEGPWDSYLGFWKRGGGATGEHSHAVNLWQHFAHLLGEGIVTDVTATLDYVKDEKIDYDKTALLNLRTESGLLGRVVQDVVTKPARKWARIQGDKGFIEWHCGYEPGKDRVIASFDNGTKTDEIIEKTRPDDFIKELKHLEGVLTDRIKESSLSINRGLDTMLVIAAAHKSNEHNRTVTLDYSKGYIPKALTLN